MSKIVRSDSSLSMVANAEMRKVLKEIENDIREKHKTVSEKETNPNHVKQKAGMDYVEFPYMKSVANQFYPGWSFKNLEIVHEFLISGWVVVQGELHFIDEGMPRVGACAAAHRIAFKKDMDRIPENIVDLGNDVKAAVTDAMKKGFNTYMNISDDIYRQIEIEDIDMKQKTVLYDIVAECKPDDQRKFYSFVDNSTTKATFQDTSKKLLKAMYSYQKTLSEDKANQLLSKFQQELINDFKVSFD